MADAAAALRSYIPLIRATGWVFVGLNVLFAVFIIVGLSNSPVRAVAGFVTLGMVLFVGVQAFLTWLASHSFAGALQMLLEIRDAVRGG